MSTIVLEAQQLQCPEGPESLTSRDVLPLETATLPQPRSPAHHSQDGGGGQESNIPGTVEEEGRTEGSVNGFVLFMKLSVKEIHRG